MKLFLVVVLGLIAAGTFDGTRPMQCHNGYDWSISGRHWNEYRYCQTPWGVRQTETYVRTII